MAASRCVYTKIQLKLLETEVEDGAEEAEVTRKLLGHYLSSDSKSKSEAQRIPVKTLGLRKLWKRFSDQAGSREDLCTVCFSKKINESQDEFIFMYIIILLCIGNVEETPGARRLTVPLLLGFFTRFFLSGLP